jgi:hypothetical protein
LFTQSSNLATDFKSNLQKKLGSETRCSSSDELGSEMTRDTRNSAMSADLSSYSNGALSLSQVSPKASQRDDASKSFAKSGEKSVVLPTVVEVPLK